MLRTATLLHPASTSAFRPTPGASLPGTLASPRTGLAQAGHRELAARLSHDCSFAFTASELLDARGFVHAAVSLGTCPDDFVLLTPSDILTRDDTWINRGDLFNGFENLPASITDAELRSQVSNYFHKQLAPKASKKQRDAAAQATIDRFPQLLDYYIALKELVS